MSNFSKMRLEKKEILQFSSAVLPTKYAIVIRCPKSVGLKCIGIGSLISGVSFLICSSNDMPINLRFLQTDSTRTSYSRDNVVFRSTSDNASIFKLNSKNSKCPENEIQLLVIISMCLL